jgi:tetratricopeptide (TPR) repeat protein
MSEEEAPAEKYEKTPEEILIEAEECLAQERFEAAIELYKEIVRAQPTLPTMAKACNDCGVAYANLEQYEMAMGFFNAALNLKQYLMDEGISTYYNLGLVYKLLGEEEEAEQCYQRAEQLKQEHKRRDDEAQRMLREVFE